MHEDIMDAEDREAGLTVGGGMLLLLGVLFAMHFAGLRFSAGGNVGFSL